jgi:hypothetical protein
MNPADLAKGKDQAQKLQKEIEAKIAAKAAGK